MAKNLTGKQFGRLTVVSQSSGRSKEGRLLWLCQCSCGNTKITDTKSLTTGKTKSCGCYSRDIHKQIFTKHGETHSKLYFVWNDMKSRLRLRLNAGWSIKDALTIKPILGGHYGT